ncbi:AsmA family protein [Marinobacter salicampi]|uniref:AsmA family protein n=1 Tax=Marinobacter salicampi TaxID=435907 RepID=UPI00140907F9|nr:AsmA family protein [Marinobacter salicampi]
MRLLSLKRVSWSLFGLLVFLVLLALVVELVSWNFLKPYITERVEAATGREMNIDGDISLSLLPRPEATVNGITLANPERATSETMVEVGQVSITPSLTALLTGDLVLADIDIRQPTVSLEQIAEAEPNWVFTEAGPDKPAKEEGIETSQTADGEAGPPINFRDLSITDGEVSYRPANADEPLVVAIPDLQVENQPSALNVDGELSFNDRTFNLDARTSSLDVMLANLDRPPGERQEFEGEAQLSFEDSKAQFAFALPEAPATEVLGAQWHLELDNIEAWSQWLGLPPIKLEQIQFEGDLAKEGSLWRARNILLTGAQSELGGELTLDLGSEPLELSGSLVAPVLDIVALQNALPESPDTDEPPGISIPVLPAWKSSVDVAVEQLILPTLELSNVQTTVTLSDHKLGLSPLQAELAGGMIEGDAQLLSSPELVQADASLNIESLATEDLNLPWSGGKLGAEFDLAMAELEQRPNHQLGTLLAHVRVSQGDISYANEKHKSQLDGSLRVSGETVPRFEMDGQFQSKPISLSLEGEPLPELAADLEEYALEADARSDEFDMAAQTTLGSLIEPNTMDIELALSDEGSQGLEDWLGVAMPPLPAYRLAGNLEREGNRWSATELDGELGGGDIGGQVHYTHGQQPLLEADVEAGRIDVARFTEAAGESAETDGTGVSGQTEPDDSAGSQGNPLSALHKLDAELELDAETLVLPGGQQFNDLKVSGNLKDGVAEVQSVSFGIADGSVSAQATLDANEQPAVGSLKSEFQNIELGQLGETFSLVEQRLGTLSGDLALNMTQARADALDDDVLLPFIGRLQVEPSRLRFTDARFDTDLTLEFQTTDLSQGQQKFQINGDGRYDGDPFSLDLVSDPLLDARDPDSPYALDMQAQVVETDIDLGGTILQPLALKGLDLTLSMEGPNPDQLSRLFGFPLPTLPPYSVYGELSLQDDRWLFKDLAGEVGDSDLRGHLAFEVIDELPHLSGELASRSLDIADLGGLVGGKPTQDDSASEDAKPAEPDESSDVLPDQPIIGERWQTLVADVSYRGESVRAGGVPLSNVVIDFRLEDGGAYFEPLAFGVGDGSVDFNLNIAADAAIPNGTMELEVNNVDLREVVGHWGIAGDSVGRIGAQGKFWIKGRSVAELLSSADGGLVMLMADGQLDTLLIELAGLDATESVFTWLGGSGTVPIDCAYLDLTARDGLAKLDTFVLDTADTSFTAGGEINFNTESLDITLQAHPKDPSVLVGRTPFHLGGTFGNVEPGIHGGTFMTRAAASVALTAAAGPIASLLPLLDLGTGADLNYCDGLVSRSREAINENSGDGDSG